MSAACRKSVASVTQTRRNPFAKRRRPVEKHAPEIRRLLPEVALVAAGISPGDLIVVTNLEQVADGSTVIRVRDEGGPEESGR